MNHKPKVAVIGTGGTITSFSSLGPLDLIEYTASGTMLEADALVDYFPQLREVAEIVPVRFRAVPSTAIDFPDWKAIVLAADQVVAQHPDLAGIVVLHGTATLEETAYALNLTAKVQVPIVLVGSQRPASALSSDAGLNLLNAVRAAASPQARGMGVLVCLNDEIQAAREVTKTSTSRLQTFRTPDFGILGQADGDGIYFYRRPLRKAAPDTEFDIRGLDALPRVDIAYAFAGDDGTAVRAFTQAGAQGIVVAAFPGGILSPQETRACEEAVAAGAVVVLSTRAGSGRAMVNSALRGAGFIGADNLNPQKARILLALALSKTREHQAIADMFATY
jgi:L-asparaginase